MLFLSWDFELTYRRFGYESRGGPASCTWYAIRERKKKNADYICLGLLAARGEKQDGTPPLSPLRAPSPPLDGRPRDRLAHDQCHLKRSPLRLEGAPPRYYLSGASRDLTTDFDNVHIPFHWDRAVSKELKTTTRSRLFCGPSEGPPPIRMPKGGSLAYLFDGTEVQPVSLPPSGNTQLGGKKRTPHERPAELPSVASSDRFRPPLAILPPPHLEYVLNPGPLSGGLTRITLRRGGSIVHSLSLVGEKRLTRTVYDIGWHLE